MKKLLFTTLIAAVILPLFSSCQKANTDSSSGNISIIGQWQMTRMVEQYYVNGQLRGEETTYADSQNGILLEFRADYTFVMVSTSNGQANSPTTGTYIKTSEMVVLTYSSGNTETLKIESMTAKDAVVVYEYTSTQGTDVYREVERVYLTKVS